MKKLIPTTTACLVFIAMFLVSGITAQEDHFVTTWNTTHEGSTNAQSITIPTHFAEDYNYNVDWNNDGFMDEIGVTGDVTHDFGEPGTYTIRISGQFPAIYFKGPEFGHVGDEKKLVSIDQWGTGTWTTFESAFKGCSNMNITATDSPDLSMVYNFYSMFANCSSLDCELNEWDMSTAYDMSYMFSQATSFNADLDLWDVSNAYDMKYMFADATSFEGDISTWDVVNMTDAEGMFSNAESFNGVISNWNTESLQDVRYMFSGASSFSQDVNSWDVSNVQDFSHMFSHATLFNSQLGNWDMSGAVVLDGMLRGAESFNRNISNWDVSGVTSMEGILAGAISFDQDISAWNTSSVTNFNEAFLSAVMFDCDLGTWDVTAATDMEGMFYLAGLSTANYDQLLTGWSGQGLQAGVQFNAGNSMYCAAEDARQMIIDTHGWTISDAGSDVSSECVTSVAELDRLDAQIYPSPAIDHLTIQFDEALSGPLTVRLIDALGREVINSNISGNQTRLNLSDLSNGLYSVIITGHDKDYQQLVIVDR